MGHRFESLSLPAHLVAWHEAGLELVRADLLADTLDTHGNTSAASPSAVDSNVEASHSQRTPARCDSQAESRPFSPHRPAVSASAQPDSAGQAVHRTQSVSINARASGRAGESSTISPGNASRRIGANQPTSTPEPCAWSGPFLYALERLKPPVRAMWTYWELAQDFGGEPDSNRRQLWANIIKSLPYKQRVGFWPVSEFRGGTMLAKPALFWQGVREFGATHVLCFGRRACMTLFPDRPFSPGVFQHGDLTAVILPGPDDMLPDNRQLKAVTWNLLKDLRI
ncbi:hypothetical protein V6C53_05650 [Desulfocurvibacter africanus]|uniref:hypothetical protein n=1 Tax=Desulfocurvibacter africanus TaxID=873 RepID=UPI002FDB5830